MDSQFVQNVKIPSGLKLEGLCENDKQKKRMSPVA